jgi:glycosyltransferase involved in cell wall biosynthesis
MTTSDNLQAGPPAATIAMSFSTMPAEQFDFAVRSIFAQSFTRWELLLISDGAPAALLRRAEAIRDRRVRVIDGGTRLGVAARMNQAARLAKAPYIFRMDADDAMVPMRLELQLGAFMERPDLDMLSGHALMIDEFGDLQGALIEPPMAREATDYLRWNPFTNPTIAGKTEWFAANQYDERLVRNEDFELWIRTQHGSVFAKLAEPLMFYRIPRRTNLAKQELSRRFERKVIRSYRGMLPSWPNYLALLARSYAKQVATRVLVLLGQDGRLYSRKSEPLAERELKNARDALRDIAETPVPGWTIAGSGEAKS